MTKTSVLDLSALDQAAAVAAGDLHARELVEESLARAERAQGLLGPFAHLDSERALAAAEAAGSDPAGPGQLGGVPYAVKDLALACAGMPLTCGSRLFGDHLPDYDSAAAARPKAAGMAVIGSTVSAEFGLYPVTEPGRFGVVRNPWSPEHTPGGSSGGAAAAVAAGVLPLAGASDAGGSIRIPAACCGLVGLKPSRGRVSLGPDMGDHFLACEGVVSRTVADTAAMLDVLAGPETGDASWAPPPERPFAEAVSSWNGARLRIGLIMEPPIEVAVDERHRAAATRVGGLLAGLGHEVEEVDPFWRNPELPDLFGGLWGVGAATFAGWGTMVSGLEPGPDTLDPLTLAFAARGGAVPAPAYAGLVVALQGYARAVVAAGSRWDAILSPALAQRPPAVGALDGLTDPEQALARMLAFTPFTPLANVTGQPAISLPAGIADDGMPLAVQLTGRPLGEATLLHLAAELERTGAWDQSLRPPAYAGVAG